MNDRLTSLHYCYLFFSVTNAISAIDASNTPVVDQTYGTFSTSCNCFSILNLLNLGLETSAKVRSSRSHKASLACDVMRKLL